MNELDMVVIFLCFYYGGVRNIRVFKIHHWFLDNCGLDVCLKLPSYDEMLLHPKYAHLWTVKQWVNWMENQK